SSITVPCAAGDKPSTFHHNCSVKACHLRHSAQVTSLHAAGLVTTFHHNCSVKACHLCRVPQVTSLHAAVMMECCDQTCQKDREVREVRRADRRPEPRRFL